MLKVEIFIVRDGNSLHFSTKKTCLLNPESGQKGS